MLDFFSDFGYTVISIKKETIMNNELSTYYKGFLVRQDTNRGGWVIINCPSRTKAGPISPGPYSSISIAENVINRIISDSY